MMKIKLDDVRVDSFATTHAPVAGRGTVHANEVTVHFSCPPRYTCPECASPPFREEPAED
jgi:hypothetical protein